MGNDNNKDGQRKEDQLRMDVLSEGFERYRLMSHVFFRRLDHKEKIDAMIEVAEIIRQERSNDRND